MNNLFWFRRDLRLNDNHGLYQALTTGKTFCVFIWDSNILTKLKPDNPRVGFIYQSLIELDQQLKQSGSSLIIEYGDPQLIFPKLVKQHKISQVIANEDYEPLAINRDKNIQESLQSISVKFNLHKDQVIFAKTEILSSQAKPYTIYTPYKNAWLKALNSNHYQAFDCNKLFSNLHPLNFSQNDDQLKQLGFNLTSLIPAGVSGASKRLDKFIDNLDNYEEQRNIPSLNSTSHLGVDLRFGTISVRNLVTLATSRHTLGSQTWLNELIWREFFSQILYNFPHVVNNAFRKEFNQIKFTNNPQWFDAWCLGETGYPIVDAGMKELNQTGFMHNRVRMICASFLVKDLLIDWKMGEQYFAQKLLDYELASNNGNWQWCASTGCDAQPYFRIFNPYLQGERFDPDALYIKKYLPILAAVDPKHIHNPKSIDLLPNGYPKPIVDHKMMSARAKQMYASLV